MKGWLDEVHLICELKLFGHGYAIRVKWVIPRNGDAAGIFGNLARFILETDHPSRTSLGKEQ